MSYRSQSDPSARKREGGFLLTRRQNEPESERDHLHEAIDDHGSMVYRLAYRILGNAADAEDTAQDVFVKYMRARRKSDGVQNPRAWLSVTALNTARNRLRDDLNRKRRERAWASRVPPEQPSSDGGDDVWRAVDTLPDELKIPLILHYQEDFKYREISEALGCPEGTVATRIARAKDRVRAHMSKMTEDNSQKTNTNGAGNRDKRDRRSPASRA